MEFFIVICCFDLGISNSIFVPLGHMTLAIVTAPITIPIIRNTNLLI